jgi:hypothetical protein
MATNDKNVQQAQQLTAQQRAALFAQATRQTIQMLPSRSVAQEGETVTFDIPKTRLLSKILVEFDAVATLKSNAASIQKDAFSPYKIIRRIQLDLNNGFSPFVIPGRDLYLYNTIRLNPDVLLPSSNDRAMAYVENTATTSGKDARIKFTVELPVTLNDRDPVGLILLQNSETNVQLTIDIDKLQNAYTLNASNNDQVTFKSLKITPMVVTFTIPSIPQAFPDLSVLKLVSSKSDTFAGNGQSIIHLNTGYIYRKLVLYFEDNNGVPLSDDDFVGNIELIFNEADIPYSMKPSVLAAANHSELGYPLPDGVYVFDFSYQGIPNLGGSRDYVDTENLTEFWVRFNTAKAGKITVVSETLSRLQ